MLYVCPACQRVFQAPGFCPTDGNSLVESTPAAAANTLLSGQHDAERHATEVERRGTFPLTPGRASSSTEEVTAARARPAQAEGGTGMPQEIRALSASEDPAKLLEAFQKHRENEYDKLVGQTLDGRYHVERKIAHADRDK